MVALTSAGLSVKAVSIVVECSVWTVRRWLRRSETTGELGDLPRLGRPVIYTEETKLRLIAFYCQTHPLPGCGRWSFRWAACHLLAEPNTVGVTPSKSTLHRILKSNHLKPHLSSYFLHITDPDFFPKMEHLLYLYQNPPAFLFFFDECPGIQILKRLVPDLQTDTMKQRLEEFEYIRNGTLDVFAFLHYADGNVALECHADHTTETFLDVFERHAKRLPMTETIHYVMDNLSSHRSYPFCRLVAQLSGISCPSGKELNTQFKRMQWLQRDDKRIVIHFTPFHGSWLNLVEIWFGIMGSKVLTESFGSPEDLKVALESFADLWNRLLAHPFRWTYDGKALHDKAVKRFAQMLLSSPTQIDIRTLTKLLKLMTNMLEDYFSEVTAETWRLFTRSFASQYEDIETVIRQEPGPLRKKNAETALENLVLTFQKLGFLLDKDIAA
jgi:transposase